MMARVGPLDNGTETLSSVFGTPGYMPPEYQFKDELSKSTDIYSFGVLLLELVTGISATYERSRLFEERNTRVEWVKGNFYTRGKKSLIAVVADPFMPKDNEEETLYNVIRLALKCTELDPKKRPQIKEVVQGLKMLMGEINSMWWWAAVVVGLVGMLI